MKLIDELLLIEKEGRERRLRQFSNNTLPCFTNMARGTIFFIETHRFGSCLLRAIAIALDRNFTNSTLWAVFALAQTNRR